MNIRKLIELISEDAKAYSSHSIYSPVSWVVLLTSVPFQVLFIYRVGHYLHMRKANPSFFSHLLKYLLNVRSGCYIAFSSEIGRRLIIPHPTGIVIGSGVVIKDDVIIYQNVTIGAVSRKSTDSQYPTIEDNVTIFANAMVIGGVTIRQGAVVGAFSLVNKDVPANSIVAGLPARSLSV